MGNPSWPSGRQSSVFVRLLSIVVVYCRTPAACAHECVHSQSVPGRTAAAQALAIQEVRGSIRRLMPPPRAIDDVTVQLRPYTIVNRL
jgi:hypothetical protein